MLIPARSISLRAARVLRPGIGGRVLASFERVCDLVTDAGEVVALVWGGIGNGPLNVVLPGDRGPGVALPAGTRFTVTEEGDVVRSEPVIVDPVSPATGSRIKIRASHPGVEASAGRVVCGKQPAEASSPGNYLAISPIVIDLTSAVPWNPQPDWDHLRARRRQIAAGAKVIAGILAEAGWTPARCGLPEVVCEQAACGRYGGPRCARGARARPDARRRRLAGRLAVGTASGARPDRFAKPVRSHRQNSRRPHNDPQPCPAGVRGRQRGRRRMAHVARDIGGRVPVTNLPIYQSTQTILSHGATSGAAMLIGFCAGVAHLMSLIPDPDT